MKKLGFGAAFLAASLTLSACGSEAEVAEVPAGVIEGVTIENARMVLAPVEGNPAAIYFDFSYEGEDAFSISRFKVEGVESTEMHTYGSWNLEETMMAALDIPVTSGTEVEFKPGDYHVMAMGVSPELQPGGSTEVTMIVSGGDEHKFTAEIRAAGEER